MEAMLDVARDPDFQRDMLGYTRKRKGESCRTGRPVQDVNK